MTADDPDGAAEIEDGGSASVHQYCTACGWSTGSDGERDEWEVDCNERMIRHYVETGHTVVRRSFGRQPDIAVVDGRDRTAHEAHDGRERPRIE